MDILFFIVCVPPEKESYPRKKKCRVSWLTRDLDGAPLSKHSNMFHRDKIDLWLGWTLSMVFCTIQILIQNCGSLQDKTPVSNPTQYSRRHIVPLRGINKWQARRMWLRLGPNSQPTCHQLELITLARVTRSVYWGWVGPIHMKSYCYSTIQILNQNCEYLMDNTPVFNPTQCSRRLVIHLGKINNDWPEDCEFSVAQTHNPPVTSSVPPTYVDLPFLTVHSFCGGLNQCTKMIHDQCTCDACTVLYLTELNRGSVI